MFDLSGRIAIITGAGRGVGANIATTLAGLGATVVVNDISPERAKETSEAIRAVGGEAIFAASDVTDGAGTRAVLEAASREIGPIDILVNNAGLPPAGFRTCNFVETTPSDWDPYFGINLYGVMHCAHAVLPSMIKKGYGRIVTIISDAGRFGEPGMAAYAASKAGAAGFTRAIAKEVGRFGITCNCLSLGSITDRSPEAAMPSPSQVGRYAMRRLGEPSDAAAAVVWLASEDAGWVTGQTISVNGGYVMS